VSGCYVHLKHFFRNVLVYYESLRELIADGNDTDFDNHQMVNFDSIVDFNVYNNTIYVLKINGDIVAQKWKEAVIRIGYCPNCNALPFLLFNEGDKINDDKTFAQYWWHPFAEFVCAFLLVVLGTMCWHYRKIILAVTQMVMSSWRKTRSPRQSRSYTPAMKKPVLLRAGPTGSIDGRL
jgi:hypothetical protein